MNIAINTTQNVTIEYELATVRERIFAFLLDYFIIIVTLAFLAFFSFQIFPYFYQYFFYCVEIPFFVFYSLSSEIFGNGQSLGKKAIGIKIIKLNGKTPETGDYLMRWAFRLIDIYFSLGMVASSLISSGNKGQRLGDLVANTTIIRVRPSKNVSLREILSIRTLESYHPKFPNVKLMKEDEMILIKQVLERYNRYPNPAHENILLLIANSAAQRLAVKLPSDKVEFLRTLLKDYVVLSR